MVDYGVLFDPIRIGTMEVENRIAMSPMDTGYPAPDGSVTDRLCDYFEERARGGVGLIITGFAYIDDKASKYAHGQLGIYDDSLIPGLNRLAEVIQYNGARAGIQISHCGKQTDIIEGRKYPIVSSSPIPPYAYPHIPVKELTPQEIEEIQIDYAKAARRAKFAGFDFVELCGSGGYLIAQFLSPVSNKRTDNYGGVFENRVRFALEVVDRVREAVGDSFPLGYRIISYEYLEGGITNEEAVETARLLEKQGVDALQVTGGTRALPYSSVPPMYAPRGPHVNLAANIKKAVSIPVMSSCGINDPALMADIVASGKADMVAMGRPLLADPFLPRKLRTGRVDDVRRCIRCNEGCYTRIVLGRSIGCTVNPEGGRERLYRITRTPTPRRVLIVGGGPAGLEAARVAALRGHNVTLLEKNSQLGGYLNVASISSFKQELKTLLEYFNRQVKALGVNVILGVNATPEVIREIDPDVVIVAVGSTPLIPNIPGSTKPHVITAVDVFTGQKNLRKDVVIIGGGMLGCESAWYLGEKGHGVKIVEMLGELASDLDYPAMHYIRKQLATLKVEAYLNSIVEEILDEGVAVRSRDGKSSTIKGDTAVLAVGFQSRRELWRKLAGDQSLEVYAAGDCVKPRRLYDAINQASYIARLI